MAYYDALKTKWATLTGTTAEKLAAINAATAPGPNVDVPASAVSGYLALVAKLAKLQSYASSPPGGANALSVLAAQELFALFGMSSFSTFQMSNSNVYAAVATWLGAFAADGTNTGIDSTDVTNMLALAQTTVLWWQANGYTSPIGSGDLAAAGGLS